MSALKLWGFPFQKTTHSCLRSCKVMMFVRLSVCLGRACIVIHFNADLSLRLDSPMFWVPWHPDTKACSSTPSRLFSSSTWKRVVVWMCKLGMISQKRLKIEVRLLLSDNRKSYMSRRLAQQRVTLSDLECLFHASCCISVGAKLLVVNLSVSLCVSVCLSVLFMLWLLKALTFLVHSYVFRISGPSLYVKITFKIKLTWYTIIAKYAHLWVVRFGLKRHLVTFIIW